MISKMNPFETLLSISEEINSTHNINILLDRIMGLALKTLDAERGFILLKKKNEDSRYEVVSTRNLSKENVESIRDHSSSIVYKVLDTCEPLISVNAQEDDRFGNSKSIILQQIHAVMCTPLLFKQKIIGAIYVDRRISRDAFNDDDLNFLKAFSSQASVAIVNAQLFSNLQKENKKLKDTISIQDRFPQIIGKSKSILHIFEMAKKIAASSATVLIQGESGTGKELMAQAIHNNSLRKDEPFIPIFCANLPENLLESELFGHKRGAFTGASDNKRGLFEEADNGTVFLDEIGELNPVFQTKLLRVIQEGEVKRVGETFSRKVDVRIISATNRDLEQEVIHGNFREDLYYRLNVIELKMPPLREREGDIMLLADHFLKYYAHKNKKSIEGFTIKAIDYLEQHSWPGNIRELENAVERAVVLCNDKKISPDVLQLKKSATIMPVGETLKEINKFAILKTIELTDGNRTKAAEILDVSRRWLQYQLKEWGMVDGN